MAPGTPGQRAVVAPRACGAELTGRNGRV